MRKPVAEGFYPQNKAELKSLLKTMFSSVRAKSMLKNISGAVVPHAGYLYSGSVAASVYSLLDKNCSAVIILGTNHTGIGMRAAVSKESWQTPLGLVETDLKLAEKIVRAKNRILEFDEIAHLREHSIEVQLPFLQHILSSFKIVAISISSDMSAPEYEKIASNIEDSIKEKSAFVVASSDFTHFGKSYGFAPVSENKPAWVRKTDAELIKAILHFDIKKFLELGRKTTACGIGPVATLIALMKKRAKLAELVDYRTSSDVSGDESAIVGYAGIVFGK